MNVVIFEDRRVEQLYPVTLSRPAYVISVGGARLLDLVLQSGLALEGAVVRPHLVDLQRGVFGFDGKRVNQQQPTLWLNARLVPWAAMLDDLRLLARDPTPRIAKQGDETVFAVTATPKRLPTFGELETLLSDPCLSSVDALRNWPRLNYVHEIVHQHVNLLEENLDAQLRGGDYREIGDGVFAAADVSMGGFVATDSRCGPIILEEGVCVRPLASLRGPVCVGAGSTVLEHAALNGFVTCGVSCKLGGEIAESVIESYSNKQHHGFLGHAYVGSWVNLGAGTSNSDLKNTYGTVRVQYGEESIDTGMQFLGCVIGDYVKTAINASIYTGRTIGTCSMVYGTASSNVPSFVNYARDVGQITELPAEVAVTTQRRMFGRRNVTHREEHAQLIREMFALTRAERENFELEVGQGLPSR